MSNITPYNLYKWCKIPYDQLENHPDLKIPFRICKDSNEMGYIMARELADYVKVKNEKFQVTRAIIPCGPNCWYKSFADIINRERISLKNLVVFHMDECLNWQGDELPHTHPYSFRGIMEKYFYEPIHLDLNVLPHNRLWLNGRNIDMIRERIQSEQVDIAYGGWGQDGHIAYNQARRNPYSQLTLDDIRNSTVRIQENNIDTIIALAHRTFGSAYQFVPPMSVTLGMKECLSAKRVMLFSDTGSWKQTALRVALFSHVTPEYPITLMQEHPDCLITATIETAIHPISEHPEWDLGLPNY